MPKIRMTAWDAVEDGIGQEADIVTVDVIPDPRTSWDEFVSNQDVQTFMDSLLNGKFGEGQKLVLERMD